MNRMQLLAAGVYALSAAANAGDLSFNPADQSPDQAAMSEAITQLLTAQLGEAGLWEKLVGRPRRDHESLTVSVPQYAITLGRATFDDNVRFKVQQSTHWVENCSGTQDISQTIETTTEVVNSYYDTQAHNSNSSLSHTVTLDAKVGTGMGTYVETSYSFNKTDQSAESANTRNDKSDDKMVKETLTLTAGPGESVAYQTNQIVLAGTRASFTATAAVNTATQLDFYLNTIVSQKPDVGVTGNEFPAFDNTPAAGQTQAAQDLHLGGAVLRSPDGSFIFGMESGTGAGVHPGIWSVIDLNSSQPGNPYRLWAPLASNPCKTPLDFVMTARGEVQLRCGSTVVWKTANSVSTGNACFYLTFAPDNPGELVCYSAPPINGGNPTFLSGAIAVRNLGEEIRPGLRHVKKSLAELIPVRGPTQEVSFTGGFDGALRVLGPVNCVIAYRAAPNASGTGCTLKGLAGVKGKTRTPAGQTASLSYCGPTNAFLQPYLARNPLAVGGN